MNGIEPRDAWVFRRRARRTGVPKRASILRVPTRSQGPRGGGMGLARTSSFLLVLCLLTTTHSQAQNPPPQLPMIGDRLGNFWNPRPTNTLRRTLWLPDMPVTSLSATTDRVLVVGSFANFGQSTGGSARLALSDAAVDLSWPRTDGPVYAIVSDGAGGWYLGGNFTLIEN